jgi:hypothetical protein
MMIWVKWLYYTCSPLSICALQELGQSTDQLKGLLGKVQSQLLQMMSQGVRELRVAKIKPTDRAELIHQPFAFSWVFDVFLARLGRCPT